MRYLILILLISFPAMASLKYQELANRTFRKHDNTLTVQIIRSSYALDWTESRGLLFSVLKNKFWFPKTLSTIGHVTVEVNCSIGANRLRSFSGQAANDLMEFRSKLTKGYGFSVLNRPNQYSDIPLVTVSGRLNTAGEMEPRFSRQLDRDNLSLVSFKLNQRDCLEALRFMREYKRQTDNTPYAGNVYGFGADPAGFSGSGCAPYVQAVLRKANLFDVANKMEQEVSVPDLLLGNPKAGKKVTLWNIISESYPLDGSYKGKQYSFSFPDPAKLYEYGRNRFDGKGPLEKQLIGARESYYVLIDRRTQVDVPQQL